MSTVSIFERHLVPGEEEGELLKLHAEFCNRLTDSTTQPGPLIEHSMNVFSLSGNGGDYSMITGVHSFDMTALTNISNNISSRTLEKNKDHAKWQLVIENPSYKSESSGSLCGKS
jgi:hypothetical protein